MLLAPFVAVDVVPDAQVEVVELLRLGTGVGSSVGGELVGAELLELRVGPEKRVPSFETGVGVAEEHLGTEDSIVDALDVDPD